MLGNNWHKKEMPLVSLAGMGGGLSSPAFLSSLILNITKPTVFSPVDDTGVPDFTYNALSSAITDVGTVDVLGDAPAFSITSWSGNDSNNRTIQSGIDNTEDSLIWIKSRTTGASHMNGGDHVLTGQHLVDAGYTNLDSSSPRVAGTETNYAKSFLDNGFVVGNSGYVNGSGNTYVSWNFRKNPNFFDIVTYTGDRNQNPDGSLTISHNLGSVPAMIMVKDLSRSENWYIYHHNMTMSYGSAYPPEDLWIKLDGDGAASRDISNWNATAPTSTEFTVGASSNTNHPGDKYVAYLFADNPSNQIKCGSFIDSGTAGQVDVGFEPRWILYKYNSAGNHWNIFDTERGWATSGNSQYLWADTINQEGSMIGLSRTATGFAYPGYSVGECIYVAIGSPKTIDSHTQLTLTDTTVSKASDGNLVEGTTINQVLTVGERIQADTTVSSTITVPVFSTTLWTGDNSDNRPLSTGIDNSDKSLVWIKCRTEPYVHVLMDTERGTSNVLFTNERYPDQTSLSLVKSFNSDGFTLGDNTNVNQLNQDFVAWNFRAAPEFFDIVTYTGDGGFEKTISHNLGSTPACVIIKRRDNNSEWMLAHAFDGGNYWGSEYANFANNALRLNQMYPSTTDSSYVGCKNATSTEFTVYQGSTPAQLHGPNHTDATYVAYLFANTSGLIKCGKTSYLPGATTENVVCGFKPAFVLAKCVSENGLWVMVDIERGLHQSGDASYLYPSKTEREGSSYETMNMNANEDGFILKATNGAGEYVYIAIAENPTTDISSLVTPEATVSASSGNIITLSDVSGAWSTGMKVRGIDLDLKDYPDAILAQDISLTSSPPTAERTVNTWGDAVWEVATDAAFTQNVQTTSTALSASGTQSGPTFSYNSNTGYYVRTKYTALGQESAWSDTNYFVTQLAIDIEKPIILTPTDGTGLPDFDYTAESSAITNIDNQTILDDFENITSRSGNYEYVESDPNGSVFVTVDVSGGNYFEVSQDGGSSWTNSNIVTSNPWISLRGHCFVDSPSYKGFVFGSYGATGSGGDVPTYKSAQGNYVSWYQAGTIPSYTSDRGRYDELATDNTGFIVACGSYGNIAYSTDNSESWTRASAGSGGTTTSTPHWGTCTYFAKLGKFVIGGYNQSASGNRVYLSADKTQVQSGNWTIHDSASNPSGFDDMACNDDYLFALAGSWSGSSVWRTSDLVSWTKIADFEATNPDMCPYKIKVKGSTIILADALFRGPNTGDIIISTDGGANWTYKRINPSDTFGSYDAAIDKDNNIVVVNDRKSPRVARTKLNANTILTLTDTTVSKASDGSLIGGESIDQVLTVGETVQTFGDNPHWIATLGLDAGSDHGHGIDVDSSGNVYICGRTNTSTAGNHDAIVAKYNSSGSIQWQRMLGGSDADEAYDIAVDSSGNSYICGRTSGNDKALIAKYSSSGTLEWQRTLEGPSSTYAEQIKLDSYGNPHICGRHQNDLFVAKYNSLGSLEWQKALAGTDGIGGGGYESGNGLAIDSSGNIYVSGDTNSGPGTYDAILVKYDSSGNEQWQKTFGGSGYTNSGEVQVDSSDNVYLCGYDDSMGHVQAYVIKYNSSGTEQWQRMVGGSSGDYAYGMAVDNSGNVYLAGNTSSTGVSGSSDYLIVKYDSSGNLQWQRLLGGSTGHDSAFSIVTDSSDNFYINGYCRIPSMTMVFAKLPGDGSLTGTYGSLTYSEINYTSSSSTLPTTPISLTNYDSTMNDAEGTLTPATPDLTSSTTTFAAASGTVSASSGNTITLSDVSGTWSNGMKVQGATTDTKDYADAINSDDVSLTSSEPSSLQTLPSGYSWDTATWQIATDENFTQNVQTETSALSATGTQTGPSFSLEPDTGYYTRTKYTALGQESAWSDVTYFVTKSKVYVDDVFSTTLWSGTGSAHEIVTGIDNTANTLIWTKSRNYANSHRLYTPAVDSIMGGPSILYSNISNNPGSPMVGDMTGFTENGFTVAADSNANTGPMNSANLDYVAWNFKAAPGFFDVVTWTGTNDGSRISHNLGSLPGMIMVKNLNSYTENWRVYAKKEMWIDGETYAYHRLELNENSSVIEHVANIANADTFNPQSMGSEVYGNRYVAYLFADDDARFGTNGDESIIKCGSVTTSSGTIPDVNLGFEPQWLLIKNTDTTGHWYLYDSVRGMPVGGNEETIYPNLLNSALTGANTVELTSTGFTGGPDYLASGAQTLIYMAIRRPHKPPTSATEVFAVTEDTTATTLKSIDISFPTDFAIQSVTEGGSNYAYSRLTGNSWLTTNSKDAESLGDSTFRIEFDQQNTFTTYISDQDNVFYNFRRAPGFMDVVTYKGGVTNQSITHNLGVKPEFIITKARNNSSINWICYHSFLTAGNFIRLNTNQDRSTSGSLAWNSTEPTSTQFTLGNSDWDGTNYNGTDYVAYLFSSLDGISKVGVYSGTGGDIDVDCGFAVGARFIMIKRTDSTGDWYVWDAARGITHGNDPYILINENLRQVTDTDYIGPLNAGFTVRSSAPATLNISGGTYLFLAIA